MSGISLLLGAAIDYERTHQLVMYTLLSKSAFPSVLLGQVDVNDVHWEPQGQLFDLGVKTAADTTYLELKMWSALPENQKKRQLKFLSESKSNGYYVLLGASWFEHSENNISSYFGSLAKKIGYEELIHALNLLMTVPNQSSDVYELALAYRNSLQAQFNRITSEFLRGGDGRTYYYSLYFEVQKRLTGIDTSIYTVNNPGGPVYILNNSEYCLPIAKGSLSGELYYEVVNGRLCIKFYSENANPERYILRDRIRKAVRKVLGGRYEIIDSGRLGAYMTACQIGHDFKDISQLDLSVNIFQTVAEEFNNIVNAI